MSLRFALPYGIEIDNAKAIIREAVESRPGVAAIPAFDVLASEVSPDGIFLDLTFWLNAGEPNSHRVFDDVLTGAIGALKTKGITPYAALDVEGGSERPKI